MYCIWAKAGYWTVVSKQFIDKRKQQIMNELVKKNPSRNKCRLVDELLRLESAVEINRTDMFERVKCPNERPTTCKRRPLRQSGKIRRKRRKQVKSNKVAR